MQAHMATAPDSSAVRVALWRALHVLADPAPHVLNDTIGLQLAAPPESWRQRPDMDLQNTRLFRAAIVARARYLEDLVLAQLPRGVNQYVILGAGLDSFAQRLPDSAKDLRVFEIDQPATQSWKQRRLAQLGLPAPIFVPVNFEAGQAWLDRLIAAGFDTRQPAVVACCGVSMYLSHAANAALLATTAQLAPGSFVAMTFLVPMDQMGSEVRPGFAFAEQGARASGTPFISFYTPQEIVVLARQAGFQQAQHVSAASLAQRYFANRSDGLHPPENAEELLLATV